MHSSAGRSARLSRSSLLWKPRDATSLSKDDPLIHRNLAQAINGLTAFLEMERQRVPGDVLWEAERLECLLFGEYDPHFEGDVPPGP
jgi:hypothetical protein